MASDICKRCGRPLSAHESVERGIGPVCITKVGGDLEADNQVEIFGNSFIHTFKGFGNCKSQCQVDIIEENGVKIVIFTDIGVGTSVTNASEQIATEIVNRLQLDPEATLFAERYRPGKKDETLGSNIIQVGRA